MDAEDDGWWWAGLRWNKLPIGQSSPYEDEKHSWAANFQGNASLGPSAAGALDYAPGGCQVHQLGVRDAAWPADWHMRQCTQHCNPLHGAVLSLLQHRTAATGNLS